MIINGQNEWNMSDSIIDNHYELDNSCFWWGRMGRCFDLKTSLPLISYTKWSCVTKLNHLLHLSISHRHCLQHVFCLSPGTPFS
jgi:hypothetical protein